MKQRPKLNDIAKALGVSSATVSNAMSGKGRVSDELVALIREKATEMGYIPSVAGRALRTGRSGVLGLVLADIAHPLFPQIAQAIENAATDLGYGVLIGDSRGDVEAQTQVIDRLIERGADGLIIVPRRGTRIGDIGCPFAVIDSPSTPGNTVSADHWNGGLLVAQHLVSLGHSKIAIIGGYRDSNVQNDRIGGMKSGLGKQAESQTIWVQDIENKSDHDGSLGVVELAKQGVTAFAAVSDLHALRALTELQRAGISVPQDVSVTGFDDLIWSNAITPTLTTMRMNMPEIAKVAVANLIAQIQESPLEKSTTNDHAMAKSQSVPMRLIIRQSCGPAKGRILTQVSTKPSIQGDDCHPDGTSKITTKEGNDQP